MNWRDQAACIGHDPELWFSDNIDEQRIASRICRTCPVKALCAQWALTNYVHDGRWGGVRFDRKKTNAQRAAEAAA